MKIVITSDCHVNHLLREPTVELSRFMDSVLAEQAEAFCVIGDISDGWHSADELYRKLLGTHPRTFFVLGNHDLWRHRDMKLPLPNSFALQLKHFTAGMPLETSWEDTETIHTVAECVFVGSIGWPDFEHPLIRDRKAFYDRNVDPGNAATNDPRYIDLTGGWREHTSTLQRAFGLRLKKAFASTCSTIIVATHYPILPGQSKLDPCDQMMWPYFYNWTMGQEVLRLARRHPEKQVWCFAGHSHEYCLGKVSREASNVFSYGHNTNYSQLRYAVFDTKAPFESNPINIR